MTLIRPVFLASAITGLKNLISGCSKKSRCEAREKSMSGSVLTDTLERGDLAQRQTV